MRAVDGHVMTYLPRTQESFQYLRSPSKVAQVKYLTSLQEGLDFKDEPQCVGPVLCWK